MQVLYKRKWLRLRHARAQGLQDRWGLKDLGNNLLRNRLACPCSIYHWMPGFRVSLRFV